MTTEFNQAQFDQTREAIEDAFASLYLIDVASLTKEQRQEHSKLLGAAYKAVLQIENAAFESLTRDALKKLPAIHERARSLQDKLAGLKTANQVLTIVAGVANLFADVVALL